jgi:hypothetical protein
MLVRREYRCGVCGSRFLTATDLAHHERFATHGAHRGGRFRRLGRVLQRAGHCPYCGRLMQGHRHGPTRDRVMPGAWGGTYRADNIRVCCRRCNELRGACGHCVGALACVLSVYRREGIEAHRLAARWFGGAGRKSGRVIFVRGKEGR